MMGLEAAVSYLLALAVPLWLVGEYMVHTWSSSHPPQIDLTPDRVPARPTRKVRVKASRAPAGRLTGSRRPA